MKKIRKLLGIKSRAPYTQKAGHSPGELTYIGDKVENDINIRLIQYDQDNFLEYSSYSVSEIIGHLNDKMINWIDVDGINNTGIVQDISSYFDFHPLMTEDILNTDHLPKFEEYEKHHFFTLKMMKVAIGNENQIIQHEHLSVVLGKNYVITFQDNVEGDVFEGVRGRIRATKGRIRKNNSDYLFYSLIDSVVDQYFIIMEYLKERMEDLEDKILSRPAGNKINDIIELKRELTNIRRVIYPVRDAVEKIFIDDYELLNESTITYFRDVRDHVYHLTTAYDGAKETVSSLMDMYMSNLSNSLNAVMKTLTMISLFFVPLTFIAGVYGMNFQYMPELGWKVGYPLILALMLGVSLTMYIYLRRKKWL